jgi:hypothetical protein
MPVKKQPESLAEPEPEAQRPPTPEEIGPGLLGFQRVFTSNGSTFRYNFSELRAEQIMCAEAIFDLYHQALRKPPRNYRELELSDQMDYLARAFSYLLRRVKDDGTLEPWDRQKCRAPAEMFFRELGGDQWNGIQEAKQDFFAKADIVDAKLMQQLAPMIDSAVEHGLPQETTGQNGSVPSASA